MRIMEKQNERAAVDTDGAGADADADAGAGCGGSEEVCIIQERELKFSEEAAAQENKPEVQIISSTAPAPVPEGDNTQKTLQPEKIPKKRGRKPKAVTQQNQGCSSAGISSRSPPSSPAALLKDEEDVCFLCYDGGDLVMCDNRSCPKAYHAVCVGQEDDFFQSNTWTCEWHVCNMCYGPSKYFCYTCTFSACKACIADEEFVSVRNSKGFCDSCLHLVLMIEENKEESDGVRVDFSDTETWEYLFKDYWREVKEKLSMTLEEIQNAAHPIMDADDLSDDTGSDENFNELHEYDSTSESEPIHLDEVDDDTEIKRTKRPKRIRLQKRRYSGQEKRKSKVDSKEFTGWASKELLDFIIHLEQDPEKPRSIAEVQRVLLTYIKENKLQDARRRSLINCDERLQRLFGKSTVGHFQMVKLLASHICTRPEGSSSCRNHDEEFEGRDGIDLDDSRGKIEKSSSDRKRKLRKKVEDEPPLGNSHDYAAVNSHNIRLVFLRRNLIEDLLEDLSTFREKMIGSFIRIKVHAGSHSCYRIVPVVGVKNVNDEYNTGRKSTDLILEIWNLSKREDVTIDTISNQDFTEEECKRLRQSIRCELLSRPTLSELEEKAKALHEVKINDWFETEILRLSHLRDRASEKGLRKQLRECVEKLQLLNSPEERTRRLEQVPQIIADQNENLDEDSDEDKPEEKNQGFYSAQWERCSRKRAWDGSRQGSGRFSENSKRNQPSLGRSDSSAVHNWSYNVSEVNINKSTWWKQSNEHKASELGVSNNPNSWDVKSITMKNSSEIDLGGSSNWSSSLSRTADKERGDVPGSSTTKPDSLSGHISMDAFSETEKLWHYRDPKGIVQGPFSMMQLRKWSNAGFFPVDLRIWKTSELEERSILLTNALVGKFQKDSSTPAGDYLQTLILKSNEQGTPQMSGNIQSVPTIDSGWQQRPVEGWVSTTISAKIVPREGSSSVASDGVWGVPSPSTMVGMPGSNHSQMSVAPTAWDRGTDESRGLSQNLDKAWTGSSVLEANQATSDGWGVPMPTTEIRWGNPSSAEASKSQNDGWGTAPKTDNSWVPANSWSDPHTTGKFPTRLSNDSARCLRNPKKEIPCKFHAKGFCKRGSSCEFLHN